MQLSRDTVIAGHPAVAIRALLRQWHEHAGAGLVEEHLGITETAAKEVIDSLIAEGFLEARRTRRDGVRFDRTVKGSALAMASAAKPLTPATSSCAGSKRRSSSGAISAPTNASATSTST